MRTIDMNAATADADPGQRTASPAAPSMPRPPLTDDEVFHLLQTNRRRYVIRYLRDHEGPVQMRDLAEQVAAWEHDTTVQGLSSEQRQRVYIPLYQTHLPKLHDAGVIEYQQARGVVEAADRIEQLYPYLVPADGDAASAADDGTAADEVAGSVDDVPAAGDAARDVSVYFGGATLLGTGLLAGAWTGLLALSGTLAASAVIVLYTAVTVGVASGH